VHSSYAMAPMNNDRSRSSLIVTGATLVEHGIIVNLSSKFTITLEVGAISIVGGKSYVKLDACLQFCQGAAERDCFAQRLDSIQIRVSS
jgi:hypothetical protein